MATALPDEASGAAAPQAPAAVAAAGSPLAGDELAFAVSHDLQQPLTQIVRFLELLAEGAAGRAGTESARLLEQARSSAARLEERYEALHRLARLESDARAHASVELDTVADRAIARLAPDCEALGGRIDRTPLPTVDGDREQLELLFQNLLGNALKFRGPEAPRVRIQGEASGNSWHFRVEDNGIGVPPKDAERIFQLFQRLHTAAETPGTGIGLALCRRIVERHGGSIWVEPRPGGGSVFHFTLSRRTAKSLDEPRSERR
jgi:signal transduction histidine kinase